MDPKKHPRARSKASASAPSTPAGTASTATRTQLSRARSSGGRKAASRDTEQSMNAGRQETAISPVVDIIAELKAGRMVVLVDEEDRENEGDLLIGAEFATAEAINFMARYGRG